MKKLVNIQSNWFIGNEYRVHHVPDNSIILLAKIEGFIPKESEAIFYEYASNMENSIKRGLLFLKTGESNKDIPLKNIGFNMYSWESFSFATFKGSVAQTNSEYVALNKQNLPLSNLNSTIMISDTNWVITAAEGMADDAALVTLRIKDIV